MQYSTLGNTNLKVSRLALGTVELGMDYGFRNSAHYKRPDVDDAIRIVHRSLDLGINFLDTARGYGESETILGRALRGKRYQVIIASKVAIDENYLNNSERLRLAIEGSIVGASVKGVFPAAFVTRARRPFNIFHQDAPGVLNGSN